MDDCDFHIQADVESPVKGISSNNTATDHARTDSADTLAVYKNLVFRGSENILAQKDLQIELLLAKVKDLKAVIADAE